MIGERFLQHQKANCSVRINDRRCANLSLRKYMRVRSLLMRLLTYDQLPEYPVRDPGPLKYQNAFVTTLASLEILGSADRRLVLCSFSRLVNAK